MSIFNNPVFDEKDLILNPVSCEDDGVNLYNSGANTYGIEQITEYHVACVFLLDTSNSMNVNDAIGQLNKGVAAFKAQTFENSTFDEHAKACIDVAFISYGSNVKVLQEFTPVGKMFVPKLSAEGMTPMGAAINKGLDMVEEHKARYKELGVPYYRPWLFCITDGKPNDSYIEAVQRLKSMEANKHVLGYCVGVENFNSQIMLQIFDKNRIFVLDNLNFTALFEFVSNSMVAVRVSNESTAGGIMQVNAPQDLHPIKMYF